MSNRLLVDTIYLCETSSVTSKRPTSPDFPLCRFTFADGRHCTLSALHTRPLLGRKLSSGKSRVSITSKLIDIKGLQLHYFGHLRKTGGRGSYRLVHTTHHPIRKCPPLTLVLSSLTRAATNMSIFYFLCNIGRARRGHINEEPSKTKSSRSSETRSAGILPASVLSSPAARMAALPCEAAGWAHPLGTGHSRRPIALQPPWCQNHHIAEARNIPPLHGV